MDNEKTFRTKTGFCHILPDKIVLTRDGLIGNAANLTVGTTIARILTLYSGISLLLFYLALKEYKNGQIILPLFFALLGFGFVYGIINSVRNSAAPVIDRQKIRAVTFKKAIVGLTRSRFEVLFEDDNGKIKKRLIMFPGSLSGGQTETQRALQIMTDENLLTSK